MRKLPQIKRYSKSRSLARLDTTKAEVEEIKSLPEALVLRDKAAALALFFQARKDFKNANQAKEIELRSERKAGEFLKKMEGHGSHGGNRKSSCILKLEEFKIEKHESHRWQLIADLPARDFDQHIQETLREGKELTQLSLLNLAKTLRYHNNQEARRRSLARADPIWLDDIELINGDFRQVCSSFKSESFDLILTDPPYGKEYLSLWAALAERASRLLVQGGFLVTYSGQAYLPHVIEALSGKGLDWIWQAAIRHTSTMPTRNVFGKTITITNSWKPVFVFSKGKPKNNIGFVDMINGEIGEKEEDDWAQGQSEAKYFIEKLSSPGDRILDPMCGKLGTTLIAAAELKRKPTGIEIDKHRYTECLHALGR